MARRAGVDTRSAADYLPASRNLADLSAAAQTCHGCDLYLHATQAVFGDGRPSARLMLVGEVPGDLEDRQGRPFVGPAGKLLDEALEEAGIPRDEAYITNAVKHFKWTPRGKRRLHAKPSARERNACRPWLEAELEAVEPEGIVCLGATAAQSFLGSTFRITHHRGEVLQSDWAAWLIPTWHPSAILRAPDEKDRAMMRAQFVEDLTRAASQLGK